MDVPSRLKLIYDPLYGFIKLTSVEWEIIHTVFYQRLRWIKQLGFSFYVFPGAEHSRFGHSIGVMHNAHKILESIGRAVSEEELMDPKCLSKEKVFHQSVRLGALMHDLGTFCFSHTTEMSYIHYAETKNSGDRKLADDHENLGSFIIKNTDYEGGITYILKKYNFDPQTISDLVKGVDPSVLANQILHSEVDCDRMDYLLRDAHYTGLQYGSYDRDYLLYHFSVNKVGKHDILTINANALHCVEDFLTSRFAWYSQVIRSPRGAKYDALAEQICSYFLKKGYIYRYSDLLEMISKDPVKFYHFNDNYFMSLVHQHYHSGTLDSEPKIKSMAKSLLFAEGAMTVRCEELKHRLISQDDHKKREKLIKQAENKAKEIQALIENKGNDIDWFISDLPQKDILFVKSPKNIAKDKIKENVLLERDPVKISYENGDIKLLAEVENSIISKLQANRNFVPNIFCSHSVHDLLVKNGLADEI